MSQEQAFLDQLAADPFDDVTRLVYADWLEDQDDPCGEYLHREAELATMPEYDPRHAALEAQLRRLRERIAEPWLRQAGKRFDLVVHDYHLGRREHLDLLGTLTSSSHYALGTD